MDGDQRTDDETRERLAAIQKGYERWTSKAGRAIVVMIVFNVLVAGVLGYLYWQIQDSRRDGVRISCREQNERHDSVIVTLDSLIADMPAGERRDRAQQSRAATVLLLEALAPRRDCEQRTRQLVG